MGLAPSSRGRAFHADAGAQHIKDGRQNLPIIFGGPSSFRMRGALRQERLDALPNLIGSVPMVVFVSLAFFAIWGFFSFYHRFPNKL